MKGAAADQVADILPGAIQELGGLCRGDKVVGDVGQKVLLAQGNRLPGLIERGVGNVQTLAPGDHVSAGLHLDCGKKIGLMEERLKFPVAFQKRLQIDLTQGAVPKKYQHIQAGKRDHRFDAPQIPLFQFFLQGLLSMGAK